MEAVKYNKVVVTQVFKALLFPKKSPIFRDTIRKLFNMRLEAGREKNASKKQTIKLLLNSIHGKFEQMIRDIKMIVADDSEDGISKIHEYYNEGQVVSDILLANNEQCLLEINKKRLGRVKDPAHLGAFVFAYSRKIMNEIINAIDGFTDWNKTFAYTDTDCLHIHNDQYKELQEKVPDLIGKENMGQFHDDIDEVKDGKVIRAIWRRKNNYHI